MAKYSEKTFKGMSDMDLFMLRYQSSKLPGGDIDFERAILIELGRRVEEKAD